MPHINVEFSREQDSLKIVCTNPGWVFTSQLIGLIISLIIGLVTVLIIFDNQMGILLSISLSLIVLLVPLLLWYLGLSPERTICQVDKNYLTVSEYSRSSRKINERRLPVSIVIQLWIKNYSGEDSSYYDIRATTTDGEDISIFHSYSYEDARFVELEIERHIGIADAQIEGEYVPGRFLRHAFGLKQKADTRPTLEQLNR